MYLEPQNPPTGKGLYNTCLSQEKAFSVRFRDSVKLLKGFNECSMINT